MEFLPEPLTEQGKSASLNDDRSAFWVDFSLGCLPDARKLLSCAHYILIPNELVPRLSILWDGAWRLLFFRPTTIL